MQHNPNVDSRFRSPRPASRNATLGCYAPAHSAQPRPSCIKAKMTYMAIGQSSHRGPMIQHAKEKPQSLVGMWYYVEFLDDAA